MTFVQQLLLLEPLALGEFDPAHATPPDAGSHESTQGSVAGDARVSDRGTDTPIRSPEQQVTGSPSPSAAGLRRHVASI
jgi:hypothetical protein